MEVAVDVTIDVDTKRVEQLVHQRLVNWAQTAGAIVANRAKSLVAIPGPPHSAPGEPPRRISGVLQASIDYRVLTKGALIRVAIFAGTPYARRLEFGFIGMDRLGRLYSQAPRPYLRPALIDSREEIVGALRG